MGRQVLEMLSKAQAGVVSEDDTTQLVRVLGEFDMYVLKDDKSVAQCLRRDGFWESWITNWFLKNIDYDCTFIDIGANTGYYSFIAALRGARVIAFEPQPAYVDLILRTMEHNGLTPSALSVYEMALSSKSGLMTLNVPEELHGSASLNPIDSNVEQHGILVDVSTLDTLFPRPLSPERQILKIDAESEEERIMQGARRFLSTPGHKSVMLEYTPGAYSEGFLASLFNEWTVAWINYSGEAEPILDMNTILDFGDWQMLLLTKD